MNREALAGGGILLALCVVSALVYLGSSGRLFRGGEAEERDAQLRLRAELSEQGDALVAEQEERRAEREALLAERKQRDARFAGTIQAFASVRPDLPEAQPPDREQRFGAGKVLAVDGATQSILHAVQEHVSWSVRAEKPEQVHSLAVVTWSTAREGWYVSTLGDVVASADELACTVALIALEEEPRVLTVARFRYELPSQVSSLAETSPDQEAALCQQIADWLSVVARKRYKPGG